MSGRVRTSAAVVLVIAVASACARSAASPSSAPTAVEPGVRLHGTYAATIPPGVNASPGEWKLTVAASGVMFTRPDGQSFRPGAVKEITANELVLAVDEQCPLQEGTPSEGRYRWTVDGTSLTFAVISDSCQDRIDTLTSSDWSVIR